jgi:hypothetical protein
LEFLNYSNWPSYQKYKFSYYCKKGFKYEINSSLSIHCFQDKIIINDKEERWIPFDYDIYTQKIIYKDINQILNIHNYERVFIKSEISDEIFEFDFTGNQRFMDYYCFIDQKNIYDTDKDMISRSDIIISINGKYKNLNNNFIEEIQFFGMDIKNNEEFAKYYLSIINSLNQNLFYDPLPPKLKFNINNKTIFFSNRKILEIKPLIILKSKKIEFIHYIDLYAINKLRPKLLDFVINHLEIIMENFQNFPFDKIFSDSTQNYLFTLYKNLSKLKIIK